MIRLIILDFDGVILESVDVKTEAFRSLFSFSPEHVDAIVDFHRKNGGMSRFDKFDYIYKNILREPLDKQKRMELSEKFSSLVFDKILTAPFVPGAREFIEHLHTRIPLYIVSATPGDELAEIVARRGLNRFFKNVYGSPRKKADCIREIIQESGLPNSEIVFVGDALNDMEAAKETRIRFIGRADSREPDRFAEAPTTETTIKDLSGLERYITRDT